MIKKKIVFTGSTGRFGKVFKKIKNPYKIFFPKKELLDITKLRSIREYLKKTKPDYFIHCAALSRPMKIHDDNIKKSIDINIIATCNIVKICEEFNVKLIYFSTNYVYAGTKGNYRESDPVMPFNNYGWSKLGGECAVQIYKNSLILRICMTEKPFFHKEAYNDVITNFMFHESLARNLLKLINKFGIINVGGKSQSVFKFAKKYNKTTVGISAKKINKNYPLKQSMDVSKFNKFVKN